MIERKPIFFSYFILCVNVNYYMHGPLNQFAVLALVDVENHANFQRRAVGNDGIRQMSNACMCILFENRQSRLLFGAKRRQQ